MLGFPFRLWYTISIEKGREVLVWSLDPLWLWLPRARKCRFRSFRPRMTIDRSLAGSRHGADRLDIEILGRTCGGKIRCQSCRWRIDCPRRLPNLGTQRLCVYHLCGDVVFDAKTDGLAHHYETDFYARRVASLASGGPKRYMLADEGAWALFSNFLKEAEM